MRCSLAELLELRHDFVIAHFGGQPLKLESVDVGRLEIRHDVDRDGVFEIGLAGDDVIDLAGEIDARLRGDLDLALLDRLLAGFVTASLTTSAISDLP